MLQDPNLFEPNYNIGKAYLDEGLLDTAERSIVRAIELRPNSWHAFQARRRILLSERLDRRANAAFSEADRLSGGDPLAVNGLAVCAQRKGDLEGAESYLRRALAKYPNNAEILTNLGGSPFLRKT